MPTWPLPDRPRSLALLLAMALLAGCAAPRPVLYPNDHYNDVGEAAAEADIERCLALAKQQGHDTGQGAEVATSTAVGSGIGAAGGGAVGAVFGSAGWGAASGAIGGAVTGLLSGLLRADEPDPVFKGFVDRCLGEQGYDPIGWK